MIKYSVKESEGKNSCEKLISVKVDSESFGKELEGQVAQVKKKVTIRGFRKGKAPKALLMQEYGAQIYRDVIDKTVQKTIDQIVSQRENEIVYEISLKEVTDFNPEDNQLNFDFTIELFPNIPLNSEDLSTKNIQIEWPIVNDIESYVKENFIKLSVKQPQFDRKEDYDLQEGDYLVCDITIKNQDDKIICQKEHTLHQVGQKNTASIYVDLESHLKDINAENLSGEYQTTTPEDFFIPGLKNQEVTVSYQVHSVYKVEWPSKEDFLKQIEQDEETVLEQLTHQITEQVNRFKQKEAIWDFSKQVSQSTDIDLPQKLYEKEEENQKKRKAIEYKQKGVQEELISDLIEKESSNLEEEARASVIYVTLLKTMEQQNKEEIHQALHQIDSIITSYEKNQPGLDKNKIQNELYTDLLERKSYQFISEQEKLLNSKEITCEEYLKTRIQ